MNEKQKYLVVAVVIPAVLCVVLFVLLLKKDDGAISGQNPTGQSPSRVVQTQTTYELPNNMTYRLDEEAGTVTLMSEQFINAPDNTLAIQYSIQLKSDGSALYESEKLLPGESILEITFPFDVPSGEYEIYLVCASLDAATGEERSSILTPLTILVP